MLLIAVILLIGCQCNLEKVEADNIEIVKKFWDAWNTQDLETIKTLLDEENYSAIRSFDAKEPKGYKKTIKTVEWNFDHFPNAKIEIVDIVAQEDRVVTMGIWESAYTIDVDNWPPAEGQIIKFSFFNAMKINSGKIIEEVEIFDFLKTYEQLGMELKPKE